MRRQRLSLQLAAGDEPRAEALLELAGAQTISLHDAADDPVVEPHPSTAPLWPNVTVRALFAENADMAPLCKLVRTACAASNVAIEFVDDADWQRGLHQELHAKPIGRRLWLAPADDERAAFPGRVAVRLNMGLAFGTGEHPTTALCLEWLDSELSNGDTVLDYGCGSGILAIAALALGAKRAWAVDNDPQALLATAANAALNGATERLSIATPEALSAISVDDGSVVAGSIVAGSVERVRVDVCVANILARPLIELAATLAAHVQTGGAIVLSGILERQADEVAAAYAPYFESLTKTLRHGWVCLAARRTAVQTK